MIHPKRIWRILLILVHLAVGAVVASYARLAIGMSGTPSWLQRVESWWHGRLCRILDVRLKVRGRLASGVLLVGNHISWLDIPVIGSQGGICFLAKSEVRQWPLLGWLAETVGTQFIRRGRGVSGAVTARLGSAIKQGRALMIFPEGTTSSGHSVLRFHPRLFALAHVTGLRIQPVAIAYRRRGEEMPDQVAPFIGDDDLVAHLLRLIRHPGLEAEVQLLAPIDARPGERRHVLAERARRAILDALGMTAADQPRRLLAADREQPLPVLVTPLEEATQDG
jgi:1-acyl-sn-glycerol-3-phosphate acyltransferase